MSETIGSKTRLDLAKEAIISGIIESLTINDWFLKFLLLDFNICLMYRVGIITFSSIATKYSPKMIRATSAARKEVANYINSRTSGGTTNYEDAFAKGFEIVKDTTDDELGATGCK